MSVQAMTVDNPAKSSSEFRSPIAPQHFTIHTLFPQPAEDRTAETAAVQFPQCQGESRRNFPRRGAEKGQCKGERLCKVAKFRMFSGFHRSQQRRRQQQILDFAGMLVPCRVESRADLQRLSPARRARVPSLHARSPPHGTPDCSEFIAARRAHQQQNEELHLPDGHQEGNFVRHKRVRGNAAERGALLGVRHREQETRQVPRPFARHSRKVLQKRRRCRQEAAADLRHLRLPLELRVHRRAHRDGTLSLRNLQEETAIDEALLDSSTAERSLLAHQTLLVGLLHTVRFCCC